MVLLSSVSITGSHFKLYCHPISNTAVLSRLIICPSQRIYYVHKIVILFILSITLLYIQYMHDTIRKVVHVGPEKIYI